MFLAGVEIGVVPDPYGHLHLDFIDGKQCGFPVIGMIFQCVVIGVEEFADAITDGTPGILSRGNKDVQGILQKNAVR
mgnify:CR=1 FL=1